MAKKIIDKLFKPPRTDTDDYVELDLGQYEAVMERGHGEVYVKVAELGSLNDLTDLKKEIYDGNVVLVDIAKIKKDKMLIDRAIKDLKKVVTDVQGDIAEVGEKDQILVTPSHVRIDRTKVLGGK